MTQQPLLLMPTLWVLPVIYGNANLAQELHNDKTSFSSALRCGGLFTGTSALRPHHGFLAQCSAQTGVWRCFRWWVTEHAARWPKVTRCASEEWCRRMEGIERLCAVLIRLALSNRAPTVELVSLITVSQAWSHWWSCLADHSVAHYGKPNVRSMPGQTIFLPAWMPVTICKAPLNFMNCCL